MNTHTLGIKGRAISVVNGSNVIIRTSSGIDDVRILFDSDEWTEFAVTITFANNDAVITCPIVLTTTNSDEWPQESQCVVPWEVIRSNGPIRVTLQGFDENNRHIITAKGSPLTVIESGDVVDGEVPENAPTLDEWTMAYINAQKTLNELSSMMENLSSMIDNTSSVIDDIVSAAEDRIASKINSITDIATKTSLGIIQIGDNINVTNDGVISVPISNRNKLGVVSPDNTTITSSNGVISAKIPPASLNVIGGIKPDGTTILIDDDSVISVSEFTESEIVDLTPMDIVNGDGVGY